MIAALFIVLAAIFKSVADTLQHHYSISVFARLPKQFWDPMISWKYVKFFPLTRYRPDAWHLTNSGMIICFILAAVLNDLRWHWYWQVLAGGLLFNITFELFYSKIWKWRK